MSVVVVIPARVGGRRLPGKALEEVGGVPLVAHVMQRASQAKRIDRVIVATDDERIRDAVQLHGGEAWMSRTDHSTGSDRVAEVAGQLDVDHVINVQGDNLLLDPETVDAIAEGLVATGCQILTPVTPFPEDADVADPSKVKVVLSEDGRALFFSRQPVPTGGPWWLHVGVYGFRADTLREFASWPQSRLEISEGLEQLRLIEHGIEIHTLKVARGAASIDTPHDLALARSLIPSSSTLRH